MTLLRFEPRNASIWASTANPVKFAWEIQKAKGNREDPDVGARNSLNFD